MFRTKEDEAILQMLREKHGQRTPKGNMTYRRADYIYNFYENLMWLGYDEMRAKTTEKTFQKKLQLVIEETGIPEETFFNNKPRIIEWNERRNTRFMFSLNGKPL